MRKKKVALWGHGLYGSENILKKTVRKRFNSLPDAYLVYNNRAANLLAQDGYDSRKLFVVYNSLNYNAHLDIQKKLSAEEISDQKRKLFPYSHDLPTLLYIGRLIPEKKIDQILESMHILHKRGRKINLIIIGNGEEENLLRVLVQKFNLKDFVSFFGPCYNEKQNAILISLSDCCVSPGNVGLTAIHCLTFGTPVISHNDLTFQMPEVSAIVEGYTGELFQRNDTASLSNKIEELVFANGKSHYSRNCMELIRKYYNPDHQLIVFNDMVNYLAGL